MNSDHQLIAALVTVVVIFAAGTYKITRGAVPRRSARVVESQPSEESLKGASDEMKAMIIKKHECSYKDTEYRSAYIKGPPKKAEEIEKERDECWDELDGMVAAYVKKAADEKQMSVADYIIGNDGRYDEEFKNWWVKIKEPPMENTLEFHLTTKKGPPPPNPTTTNPTTTTPSTTNPTNTKTTTT